MLRQIKDLSDEDLRLFTKELNKYVNERLGTNPPTDDLTDEQNPHNTTSDYKMTPQKTTRNRTRQDSEADDINTKNRFDILQEEEDEMKANHFAERAPHKEKRGRIPPIILKK
ncbi:hypothetical protein ILUMI_13371 [Ignelater luminosus]|uniref:Uncharacterized protein n=1 Tax=Ignelater luminosus TaxID=2038154 RepID=A0A8K0CWV4_IGNLU|nr:hypothetical protein ILUMI_13371 [Ignelater luminosus]